MNVIPCSIQTLKGLYDISGVEVGQHLYWQIGGLQIHAQVLITSWVVIAILLGSVIIAVRNPQTIPTDGQNFFEYVLEFIQDLSKTQIGEGYGPWVPFIGTMFLFIFVSNWSGALLPWKIIFPILSPDPATKKDVHFLKYPIYVGGNRGRGQIYPDGSKSNNTVYNATSAGIVSRIARKEKGGYEISIVDASEGRQVVDIIPPGPELLVSEGESIKLDQPLTSNPNVGGFEISVVLGL